jgi:hypothetical protein
MRSSTKNAVASAAVAHTTARSERAPRVERPAD